MTGRSQTQEIAIPHPRPFCHTAFCLPTEHPEKALSPSEPQFFYHKMGTNDNLPESLGYAIKYSACKELQLMFLKWPPGALDVDHHNNYGPGKALTCSDSFGGSTNNSIPFFLDEGTETQRG